MPTRGAARQAPWRMAVPQGGRTGCVTGQPPLFRRRSLRRYVSRGRAPKRACGKLSRFEQLATVAAFGDLGLRGSA